MDVNQAASKWGCSPSTVRTYCRSGIIPPAEKVGVMKKWYIPDEWEKPPFTRTGLCYLMDTIEQLKEGVVFAKIKWGYPEEKIKEGYDYLISHGFISSFDLNRLEYELFNSSLTSRGKDLLNRERQENRKLVVEEQHRGVEFDAGVLKGVFGVTKK